ncbi:AAA family ATPase [bacterium]|nr:AAA family ATPase [bacterium]
MRFTVRSGTDPIARADGTLLAAMGLPGGGVVRIGSSHVMVRPGDVPSTSDLLLGPRAADNCGVTTGLAVEAKRATLTRAHRVILDTDDLPLDARHLARSLQGTPVTTGDLVAADIAYGESSEGDRDPVRVLEVIPSGAGLVGSATVVATRGETPAALLGHSEGEVEGETPSTSDALLAGLEAEVDMMTGWLSLLTGPGNLPAAWGLPTVAGVLVEGPSGCGKSELVSVAAERVGATVKEVSLDLVFKPERLVDLLEKAVTQTVAPAVVFVDRLDSVAGEEGMFRTQVAAIFRWFLDAIADKPRIAVVLGASSVGRLEPTIADSPLLPRTLSIPPPDLNRRRMLFQAALGRVPTDGEIDFDTLASRTAGFSGADVVAAVVNASAMAAGGGRKVTIDQLMTSVADTTPSLGSVPTGEIPSYGFEKVANLDDVKQRLTEAVIWPVTDPDRFSRLGIEPPGGLLLYGPPGTGKTFVIRALAHESGAAFFAIKGAELLDKYVGESERGVREVFARARAAAPAILFFDEIDAIAPVRGRSTTSVTDSVVAALLTEMDGIGERGDIVVIGATNRKDLIDPALLRAGRLESHIELGLPEPSARKAMLMISDVPYGDDVDLDDLAEATEGLSFADIGGMLREAALGALRRDAGALAVTWDDLSAALARYNS